MPPITRSRAPSRRPYSNKKGHMRDFGSHERFRNWCTRTTAVVTRLTVLTLFCPSLRSSTVFLVPLLIATTRSWKHSQLDQGSRSSSCRSSIPRCPRTLSRGTLSFFRLGGEGRSAFAIHGSVGQEHLAGQSLCARGLEEFIAPVPCRLGL